MGSGRWSTDVYRTRVSSRQKSGAKTFAYYEEVKESGKLKVHPTLDPHGVTVRESRDSEEHPESNAIAVLLDVTGSMRKTPVSLQNDLPQLLGLLLYKDYIPHPQILFGAIGDAYSDSVPLQIGQFESDNRMDDHLQNLVLEGGGGPYGMESYELALYFMARHTVIDCYEKRGKKGYLFLIGDERAYKKIKRRQVNDIVDSGLESDMLLTDILAEVQEKYHLYFIIPTEADGGGKQPIQDYWKKLLGVQHVLALDNAEDIAELIALTIGMVEGTIDLDTGREHLKESGLSETGIVTVTNVLSGLIVTGK